MLICLGLLRLFLVEATLLHSVAWKLNYQAFILVNSVQHILVAEEDSKLYTKFLPESLYEYVYIKISEFYLHSHKHIYLSINEGLVEPSSPWFAPTWSGVQFLEVAAYYSL